jgi:hypothetical protein
MTFSFCWLHRIMYMFISLWLVGSNEPWFWTRTLGQAVANGLLSVVLFAALDRLKRRM